MAVVALPCACCERCRWCWCGGAKLPDALTAQVTLTSTWAFAFGAPPNPANLYNGISPVAVALSLDRANCRYYGSTDTTLAASVGCGAGAGACGTGGSGESGSVTMRTQVTLLPCEAVTSRGRYSPVVLGRFAAVVVGPVAVFDGYGNPKDCGSFLVGAEGLGLVAAQLVSNTTPTGDGGTGTLACSGGHLTYDASTTVDHAASCGGGLFTGTTTIALAVTD